MKDYDIFVMIVRWRFTVNFHRNSFLLLNLREEKNISFKEEYIVFFSSMSCIDSLLGHPRSYYDLKMLPGSSGDNMPFSSQFDDIEKAIENLVKCGKPFFWKSPLLSVTRPYYEYDYRSYPLLGRHSNAYESDHMRSRSAISAYYPNQYYYTQRSIGHPEQFPLSRRRNKSNSECNMYTTLEKRLGADQSSFFHDEIIETLVKDNNPSINDDDMVFSGFSIPSKVLSSCTYDESCLKNWSSSALALQQGSPYQSFACFRGSSANLNFVTDNKVVNNVVISGDAANKPSFFYRRKSNIVAENNENLSLLSSNRMKNMIAPIGTKSSNLSLSVDSLNRQILDVTDSAKPLQYCFSGDRNLKNDIDNNSLKYADSGVSISWDNRIWGDDVKNLGIASSNNGLRLDVLC
ncbi:uncharacterized protein T551_02413 [Pneumocystis jirovecii RU7]|uniref:Uncharacterized protein n=1 Tax=Pneumocystis jirovecii (strain RU7) TaxID=1408657 RepID=A0A0W4ZL85_PNEJ7|nr:uncharacterized protein T551_02413 [Pneumocystis jirovecii RU7]KTW29139.1 hypothetical protein T551_02413 [Pneumocystis jirovecii RU7]